MPAKMAFAGRRCVIALASAIEHMPPQQNRLEPRIYDSSAAATLPSLHAILWQAEERHCRVFWPSFVRDNMQLAVACDRLVSHHSRLGSSFYAFSQIMNQEVASVACRGRQPA